MDVVCRRLIGPLDLLNCGILLYKANLYSIGTGNAQEGGI